MKLKVGHIYGADTGELTEPSGILFRELFTIFPVIGVII